MFKISKIARLFRGLVGQSLAAPAAVAEVRESDPVLADYLANGGQPIEESVVSVYKHAAPKLKLEESRLPLLGRLLSVQREHQRQIDEKIAEAVGLERQAAEIKARSGNLAEVELNRREALRLRGQAEGIREDVAVNLVGKYCLVPVLTTSLEGVCRDVVQEEGLKIANQGELLVQSVYDPAEGSLVHKEEVRIVRLPDGRIFRVGLRYPPITRVEGTKKVRAGGGYKPSEEVRTVDNHVPTGEFGPPVVEFVTSAPEQFSKAELAELAAKLG